MKRLISLFICITLMLTACAGAAQGDPTTAAERTDALTESRVTDEPTEKTTDKTTERLTAAALTEELTERLTELITEQTAATEQITEPPTESLTEPPTEPATEPPTERVTEPPTEPVTEPPTEPVTEPPTEPVTEPPTEPVTEPPTEPVTEPVFTDATQFTVSNAFGSDMVIQRNEYIRIWGFANKEQNGRHIYAEFGGLTGDTVIEDGHWLITLDGTLPECTEPRQIRVYGHSGVEATFDNVLVGDVYWVVGQSNIHYSVQNIKNEPLANAAGRNVQITNSDLIRLNRSASSDYARLVQGTTDKNEDVVIKRGWQKPEQGARDFSAIGYFTAKQIYDRLEGGVPIGMIEFDGNGLGLNSFCPNEVCDALKIDSKDSGGIYRCKNVVNNGPSRFMYNHYMYPFQNMPISGIIWYQGESDCLSPNDSKYPERFSALITELRSRHDQINHDYPVYIVEFPPIWAVNFPFESVRTYMGTIPNVLANAHLCQSSDLWKDTTYANNLHPYVKWEQAQRMSGMILAGIYGIGDPAYVEGPSAISATYEDDGLTAYIKFRNVGSGLRFEGDTLKGVKYKTSSAWLDPVSVEIVSEDTVRITAKYKIKCVGFNVGMSDSFPETLTLCNSEGIPCNAFIIR